MIIFFLSFDQDRRKNLDRVKKRERIGTNWRRKRNRVRRVFSHSDDGLLLCYDVASLSCFVELLHC